jgi:hypothetical protein
MRKVDCSSASNRSLTSSSSSSELDSLGAPNGYIESRRLMPLILPFFPSSFSSATALESFLATAVPSRICWLPRSSSFSISSVVNFGVSIYPNWKFPVS